MSPYIFVAHVLVCLSGQTRDECTKYTAQDDILAHAAPTTQITNELMCARVAQEAIAALPLDLDGKWLKITCEREKNPNDL